MTQAGIVVLWHRTCPSATTDGLDADHDAERRRLGVPDRLKETSRRRETDKQTWQFCYMPTDKRIVTDGQVQNDWHVGPCGPD